MKLRAKKEAKKLLKNMKLPDETWQSEYLKETKY